MCLLAFSYIEVLRECTRIFFIWIKQTLYSNGSSTPSVFCEVFTQIYDSQFESKQLATSTLPGHILSRIRESTATQVKSDIEAYTCFVIQVSQVQKFDERNHCSFFSIFSHLLVNYCQCNLKIISIFGAHRWEESRGIDIHKDQKVWGCIKDVVGKSTLKRQAVNRNFHKNVQVFVSESDK